METKISDVVLRVGPWIAGLIISIGVVMFRNEWTTNQTRQALFTPDGEPKLVNKKDCERCQIQCQTAFKEAMAGNREMVKGYREETREDIMNLHKKIDALPGRIINLIKDIT